MRRNRLVCLVIVTLVGLPWIRPTTEPSERYQRFTASQWEAEIRQWKVLCHGSSNKTGVWTFWVRKQSFCIAWLRQVGFDSRNDQEDMPLLQGDPAAVPVLIQLLSSHDSQARLLAAEGLEKVGASARPAVPALLGALDDEDEVVREQVEQALFRIDREAAERAGLEWTNWWGLVRRDR